MYQVADMEQDVDVIGPHNGQDDGDKRHQEGVSSDSADTAEDLPSSDEDYSSFSKAEKRYIVFIVAWAAFFSPLSANIYFPALTILSSDLHVSLELMNLTITSYMICQGIIPSILGDLADTSGRRPVYLLAFIVYLAANIGLAIQDSYPALLVLRMLQSTGSAGTIAVGYGVATDIASPAERGKYLGAMLCGPNTAPSVGPILGGLLTERAGWRWIFWFLAILAGGFLVVMALFLPETSRNIVGNGSIPPRGLNKTLYSFFGPHGKRKTIPEGFLRPKTSFPNPLGCLLIIFHKDTSVLIFSNSLFYMTYCCIQASIPPAFERIYHLNPLQVGLIYLPFGIGCGIASYITGILIDRDYRITAHKVGFSIDKRKGDDLTKFPIERARLRTVWALMMVVFVGTVGYGWSLQARTHIAVPLILHFLIGLTVTGTFNVLGTLLMDLHPECSATASASMSIVRCSVAAGGISVLQVLIERIGYGWTFTIFGVACAMTWIPLYAEKTWGWGWRIDREQAAAKRLMANKEAREKDGEAGTVEAI